MLWFWHHLHKLIASSSEISASLIETLPPLALHNTRSTIRKNLDSLPPPCSPGTSSLPLLQPLTPGLAQILANLLDLFRQSTTSLSLAIAPPIAPPAVIATLAKLSDEFTKIIMCVLAAPSGSAVEWEWRDGVHGLGQEVVQYLEILETDLGDGDGYLAHTGMVWEALVRSGPPSRDETEAVARRWEGQRAMIKDAWQEFCELLEEDEHAEEPDEEDEDLDAMFGGAGSLSTTERSRVEAAKPILALHQILHHTILRYLPQLVLEPERSYLPLLEAGNTLAASFDTAVSVFHPPQDEAEIEEAMSDQTGKAKHMSNCLRRRLEVDGGPERMAQCRNFLHKWDARLETENANWSERRLSLASLDKDLIPS